jgi:hypothetical protein
LSFLSALNFPDSWVARLVCRLFRNPELQRWTPAQFTRRGGRILSELSVERLAFRRTFANKKSRMMERITRLLNYLKPQTSNFTLQTSPIVASVGSSIADVIANPLSA